MRYFEIEKTPRKRNYLRLRFILVVTKKLNGATEISKRIIAQLYFCRHSSCFILGKKIGWDWEVGMEPLCVIKTTKIKIAKAEAVKFLQKRFRLKESGA